MYTIFFEDGTTFGGGEPDNSLWNEMPNKPIKKLIYKLFGKTIELENYEEYNHSVFCNYVLGKNKTFISSVQIKVKYKLLIKIFEFNYFKKQLIVKIEENYGLDKAGDVGWKLGFKNKIPHQHIF